jgi:cell division protein FtsB
MLRRVFRGSAARGGTSPKRMYHKERRSVRKRFTILFMTAFVSVFGPAACAEEAGKEVQEQSREVTQQIEDEAQEAKQQIDRGAKEVQKQ